MSLRNFKFAKSLNETSIKGNNQEFPTNGISDNEHNEKCHQNIFQRIFYLSGNLVAPSQVCIILNEDEIQNKKAFPKFDLLINTFSSLGAKSIIFYQFKEINCSIKERFEVKDDNNNISEDRPTKLNFLSHKQIGKDLLVKTCKNLSELIKVKKIESDEISKNMIDEKLYELSNMKEPELIISIGSNGTVSGFSPWHIRLSEIIKIPDYKLINELYLINILSKYNKIEKRLGK